MADVRIGVPAAPAPAASGQARLVAGDITVTLPWWPTDIGWDSLAQNWSEQPRPGRVPLLVLESQTLPEVSIGCVIANKDNTTVGDGGSVLETLNRLDNMTTGTAAVQLILASRDTGRWRITGYAFTELEHDGSGNPVKAEVSMTLKRAEDAAAPLGPVPKGKKPGKKRRH